MYISKVIYFLCFLLILLSFSQDIGQPTQLFTLDSEYFVRYGQKFVGARAIEYFNNSLYIAFDNLILQTDLNGNIISQIDPNVQGGADRIMDIVFYNGLLYAYTPPGLIRIIKDGSVSNKFYVNFYATDISNPQKMNINLTFNPKFIFNLNGNLLFSNRTKAIKLSDLTMTKVMNMDYYNDSDVYLNVNQITPQYELPISDCESVVACNFDNSKNLLKLKIKNSCTNKYSEKFSAIPSPDPKEGIFNFIRFIPNNYLLEYYIFGSFKNRISKEKYYSLLILNSDFEIEKVANNIIIFRDWEGYPSPDFNSSFTCDELGNVYYCTNKYNFDIPENSTLIINKIGRSQ